MPSDDDDADQPTIWIPIGTALVWVFLLFGLLLGFFIAESLLLVRSTLITAWGLFTLLLLWRIALGVERLAYDT